ncbi:uncharacterized protein LOC110828194 isoform X1 [Zootermopsis nevadensis]|uniref:uncharacterized protein LOC110828194 isoform X1 n=1 Tax=Zootermopsis nevadensis TaxID=136037 RepID=UPI000B8ECB83|nr:uncharacterized protein LOC110828194 isoform X1 [Zootermopsis nevadensis]
MEKPSSSTASPTSSEKEFGGGAIRRPTDPSTGTSATDTVTVPSRQAVAGKLFKKCKSATFQIDGATYTIAAQALLPADTDGQRLFHQCAKNLAILRGLGVTQPHIGQHCEFPQSA